MPQCPGCGFLYNVQHGTCAECGRDLTLPPTPAERDLDELDEQPPEQPPRSVPRRIIGGLLALLVLGVVFAPTAGGLVLEFVPDLGPIIVPIVGVSIVAVGAVGLYLRASGRSDDGGGWFGGGPGDGGGWFGGGDGGGE